MFSQMFKNIYRKSFWQQKIENRIAKPRVNRVRGFQAVMQRRVCVCVCVRDLSPVINKKVRTMNDKIPYDHIVILTCGKMKTAKKINYLFC